jgi:hypothetical protein
MKALKYGIVYSLVIISCSWSKTSKELPAFSVKRNNNIELYQIKTLSRDYRITFFYLFKSDSVYYNAEALGSYFSYCSHPEDDKSMLCTIGQFLEMVDSTVLFLNDCEVENSLQPEYEIKGVRIYGTFQKYYCSDRRPTPFDGFGDLNCGIWLCNIEVMSKIENDTITETLVEWKNEIDSFVSSDKMFFYVLD